MKKDFWIELTVRKGEDFLNQIVAWCKGDRMAFVDIDYDFGDFDCEFYFGFLLDKEASDMLLGLIVPEGCDPEEEVKKKFSGVFSVYQIGDFLKKNGIPYTATSDKYQLGC